MLLQLPLSQAASWYELNCQNCQRLCHAPDPKTGYPIPSPYSCHVEPTMATLAIAGEVEISESELQFVAPHTGPDFTRPCRNFSARFKKEPKPKKAGKQYRFLKEPQEQGSLF